MLKFAIETQEQISIIKSDTEMVKALYQVLDQLVESQEKDLLRLALTPENEKNLIQLKARAEGARRILIDFKAFFSLK